uniref:Uncharacterized protein n=1 Tax=Rhizophora mucronata TaxID=61149 RepID=A0A2P2IQJ7_RHIMU
MFAVLLKCHGFLSVVLPGLIGIRILGLGYIGVQKQIYINYWKVNWNNYAVNPSSLLKLLLIPS